MTSYVSPEVVRSMGFDDIEPERLVAAFSGFTAYEIRGLALAPDDCQTLSGTAAAVPYKVGLSSSINSASRAISGDVFADDEHKWKTEVGASGPFALVQVGPTAPHEAVVSRVRREPNGSVMTYDAFVDARKEVRDIEHRALPRIVSALTCALNDRGRYVALRKVARSTVGELVGGGNLFDVHLEVKGEAWVYLSVDPASLESQLTEVGWLASTLNERVARFLFLGSSEDDQLKRFLYFFLALEIQTHATFRTLDHESNLGTLVNSAKINEPTKALLLAQISSLKGLHDRFAWCAASEWKHLSADDVTLFKQLKQARDSIAHGTTAEPPTGYARLAEQLLLRLLRRDA